MLNQGRLIMTNSNQQSLDDLAMIIPEHVAIIMDGNGRWAEEKGLERSAGHQEGVEAIRRVTMKAHEYGIKVLTLYAFSTENWKRPFKEIQFLMNLPKRFFNRFLPELIENNVKVTITGFEQRVPDSTRRAIDEAIEKTKHCTGMILNIAFNYGGRAELVKAFQEIATDVQNGKIKPKKIDEKLISSHLLTAHLGEYQEVDFLIRTSGEQRISNFLLWQSSYSELHFSSEYWPDYNGELFERDILEYQKRNRRFGGV